MVDKKCPKFSRLSSPKQYVDFGRDLSVVEACELMIVFRWIMLVMSR